MGKRTHEMTMETSGEEGVAGREEAFPEALAKALKRNRVTEGLRTASP